MKCCGSFHRDRGDLVFRVLHVAPAALFCVRQRFLRFRVGVEDNLLFFFPDLPDAFFPAFDAWRCTKRTYHPSNEQHAYPFWIATYQRTV